MASEAEAYVLAYVHHRGPAPAISAVRRTSAAKSIGCGQGDRDLHRARLSAAPLSETAPLCITFNPRLIAHKVFPQYDNFDEPLEDDR